MCVGGGTGLPIVLKALRKIDKIKIYAVPTIFDDGGDTASGGGKAGLIESIVINGCTLYHRMNGISIFYCFF